MRSLLLILLSAVTLYTCGHPESEVVISPEVLMEKLLDDEQYVSAIQAYQDYLRLKKDGLLTAKRPLTSEEIRQIHQTPTIARNVYRDAGFSNWEPIGKAFLDYKSPEQDIKNRYNHFFRQLSPEQLEATLTETKSRLGI